MPHLSPMQWLMMIASSWMLLSLMSINIHFINNKPMNIKTKKSFMDNMSWKW